MYNLGIFKFRTPAGREKALFKISLPDELYNIVVQSGFWPQNTFVREFQQRPIVATRNAQNRPTESAASSSSSNAKNDAIRAANVTS